MTILEKGIMKDGTQIQLEDWSEEYPNLKGKTLAAYPIAKRSLEGSFAPKEGKTFRCCFTFREAVAKEVFEKLKEGKEELIDYKEFLNFPKNAEAL